MKCGYILYEMLIELLKLFFENFEIVNKNAT